MMYNCLTWTSSSFSFHRSRLVLQFWRWRRRVFKALVLLILLVCFWPLLFVSRKPNLNEHLLSKFPANPLQFFHINFRLKNQTSSATKQLTVGTIPKLLSKDGIGPSVPLFLAKLGISKSDFEKRMARFKAYQKDEPRMRGVGEQGQSGYMNQKEKRSYQAVMQKYAFNKLISDRIRLDRSLVDMRPTLWVWNRFTYISVSLHVFWKKN